MSLIFDALQRSETERSGTKLPSLSAATEVLRLAELHVAAERKSAERFVPEVTAQGVEQNQTAAVEERPPARTGIGVDNSTLGTMNGGHQAVFPHFESLRCAIPPENRLVGLSDDNKLAAEKFRFLGVSLKHLQRERQLKRMLITSTIPQEGKSMVAANLACALGRAGREKILLVEGDVRRPSLSNLFGLDLDKIVGLCDYLQGERDLMKIVYHLPELGIWFLPAGAVSKTPLELLQTAKLPAMTNELSGWFDWIIIDSPPVMPLADTSVWARLADGILMVVRQGVTEKRQLERGLEAIDPTKVIGSVLNGSKTRIAADYYYAEPQS
jgi:capsular exopolysaccharide synthesis family protein